jgi:hypothetical protein
MLQYKILLASCTHKHIISQSPKQKKLFNLGLASFKNCWDSNFRNTLINLEIVHINTRGVKPYEVNLISWKIRQLKFSCRCFFRKAQLRIISSRQTWLSLQKQNNESTRNSLFLNAFSACIVVCVLIENFTDLNCKMKYICSLWFGKEKIIFYIILLIILEWIYIV